jgi:hypothetical protein
MYGIIGEKTWVTVTVPYLDSPLTVGMGSFIVEGNWTRGLWDCVVQ